jgi:hypothetical protein
MIPGDIIGSNVGIIDMRYEESFFRINTVGTERKIQVNLAV